MSYLHRRGQPRDSRPGNILILVLLFLVVLVGVVAFAVDLGYLLVAKTELQVSADAAALAGTWELIDQSMAGKESSDCITAARATAQNFAGLNSVCTNSPALDANDANGEDGEIVIGTISSFNDPNATMTYDDPSAYNAVKVKVRRTSGQNGIVPFFFARVFGFDGAPAEATATAGFFKQAVGFRVPADGNLGILPFALDIDTWNKWENGELTDDNWSWDAKTGAVVSGSDGIPEMNLYPQDTGSSANRSTVNIGGSNNSTSRVARQILDGITADDLDYHGGSLEFGDDGTMVLEADPGISAGFKDELATIIGQPRVIPIFSELTGNGGKAEYTIVKYVGVRVVEVDLTGGDKRLMIQPAVVVMKGLIPSNGESGSGTMEYVYSPPYLIR